MCVWERSFILSNREIQNITNFFPESITLIYTQKTVWTDQKCDSYFFWNLKIMHS